MTSRPLRATNAARSDLLDIWLFVAQGSVDAADRALDRIGEAQSRLVNYPEAGPRRAKFGAHIRVLIVDRYLIFDRIDPDEIVILRVFDGRRNVRPEDLAVR